MPDAATLKLIQHLSEAAGPPGYEDPVRRRVADELHDVGTLRHDRLGGIQCEKVGDPAGPRVLLDSHLDEVGMMVQQIDDDGRLRFVTLGGFWAHVLLAQRVRVLTGATGPADADWSEIPGIIASQPPHFLTEAERGRVQAIETLSIDVGASDPAGTASLGIAVGDPVVPDAEFRPMGVDGVYSGKALDNRLGVALMCQTMQALADRDHPNTVIGVGAVQEEVGTRGAGPACELANPDVAIVLECTPSDDFESDDTPQGAVGAGPQIRFCDPRAIAHPRLLALLKELSSELDIPVQWAVRRSGGTDAAAIQTRGHGVPTVVVAVPARYIHSHVALFQISDYLAARRLVFETVLRLDRKTVDSWTCNDRIRS
ncbi:MAG: M20/M25/M40 family metallo-hydrolase [Acidobacteriota bacterium]|nr:M20/M25/M40 family metallo-hydrolase [Acidobacteriota bacterium]MDH3786138.1 M20/M25/M40 family metallo-hydrolase [Acidobacteriota bacterium]